MEAQRQPMMTTGLKRLKVGLIWSVLVLLLVLGYVTVINPFQLTQLEYQHMQRPNSGLLKTTDSALTETRMRRLKKHQLSQAYLARVKLYNITEMYLENASNNKTLWREIDVMKQATSKCDPEFTNPCWWEEQVPENTCPYAKRASKKSLKWMELRRGKTLRCLPYFFIIGQAKCGTTTLFNRIVQHPDVAPHAVKETQWIGRIRLRPSCSSIDTYLNCLQTGASFIQSKHRQGEVNPYVIADATPGYFSLNDFWDMLPGNEGCTEPCVTNADVTHHLNPRAKLLLILRNPTTRLYSLYFHKGRILRRKSLSKHDFHDMVVTEIAKFQNCLTSQSLRGCCYNYSLTNSLTEALDIRRGIYHVFLSDWMKLFRRDQIHVIKFEDHVIDEKRHLAEIFKFLNLRKLSDERLEHIANGKILNTRGHAYGNEDMMDTTRELIDEFYKPYNKKLSIFMEDEKWNW
ncbi:carbohydrate sulfotransferase 15-like [Haliotis rubra]|uniref:carbohydrate sulfotransferase 15-like n=1 Tax=Haliotis rubra TaxID=36100 RepID=UPI001EE6050C|nr:carbohydrate sulfotransferase 15-like [Haliotis rubra]